MASRKQAEASEVEEGAVATEEQPASSGRDFVVKHKGITGPITPYLEGQVIGEDELLQIEGVDIDRLLSLGAIRDATEADEEEYPPVMEHPENQAFVTSTGTVVDQPGLDRPNIVDLVKTGEVKVQSAKERLKMFAKGRRTTAEGGETDPVSRDPEAIAEQQRSQRNLRDNNVVPAETAEAVAAGEEVPVQEEEPLDPDALDQHDPSQAPDMVPEPRRAPVARRR